MTSCERIDFEHLCSDVNQIKSQLMEIKSIIIAYIENEKLKKEEIGTLYYE